MMEKNKIIQVTCGVLITDRTYLLICHPTNGKYWDIPKGRKDPNEEDIDAAIRELKEETGIVVNSSQLQDLGLHNYKPTKILHLYRCIVNTMPDVSKLHCKSTFEWYGKQIPEMDDFRCEKLDTSLAMLNPSMQRVLININTDLVK